MSPSLVSGPRLTRIAERAISGPRPMASSTWLALTLPEKHAAPALTAMPVEIELDDERLGRPARQRDARGVGDTRGLAADDHRRRRHAHDAILEHVAQAADARYRMGIALQGRRGGAEAGDAGDVLSSTTPAPLLPAAL